MRKRDTLLIIGMGLSLFVLSATLINISVFPYARICMKYAALPTLSVFFLVFGALYMLGIHLDQIQQDHLERTARVTRPLFILFLLICHLTMGYLLEYAPIGDNHMLYDGSYTLARLGNFGGDDYDLYLSRFSNQWGFMLMLTVFHKLLLLLEIENRFYALVLVQAMLYAPAINCLLSMARKLFGVRGEIVLTLLLAFFPPLYLAAAVLYTDTFSLPFVIFTLYFALKIPEQENIVNVIKYSIYCGLCAFIGCQIKMSVAIVLIAAVIVWCLTMNPVRSSAAVLLSAAIVITGTQYVHKIMTTYVLDPAMVDQHNTPAIHWVMMSIPSSKNPYGGLSGDYGITWSLQENGASREEVMNSIYSRMKDKIYTLRYPNRLFTALLRKNAASQGDGTFGMTEMLDDRPVRENYISSIVLEGRPLYASYMTFTSGIWYAVLAYAALSVYMDIRKHNFNCAIITIAILGIQIFLLLWEARGRYMFNYTPLMLLLAAGSISQPSQYLSTVKEGPLWKNVIPK